MRAYIGFIAILLCLSACKPSPNGPVEGTSQAQSSPASGPNQDDTGGNLQPPVVIEGAIPDYVVKYPGGSFPTVIRHQMGEQGQSGIFGEGRVIFSTSDPSQRVLDFYADAFTKAGFAGTQTEDMLVYKMGEPSREYVKLQVFKSEALGTLVHIDYGFAPSEADAKQP
jgi:hypothetical protein